jgi:uncharacterized OB-fold protein
MSSESPTSRPVLEGAFTLPPEDAQLIASRCSSCQTHTFPRSFACPDPTCRDGKMEDTTLSRRGKLASWTVVHYPPPPPHVPEEPFEPFGIAEVSFPEGIQIVGPMTKVDLSDLKLGMELETVVETYYVDHDGEAVLGWKFRSVEEEE